MSNKRKTDDPTKIAKHVRNQAGTIYKLVFSFIVLLFALPGIISILQYGSPYDPSLAADLLKLSSLLTVLAIPFSCISYLGNAPGQMLSSVFPNYGTALVAKFPVITNFQGTFNSFAAVPDFVFVIPIFFLLLAALYLGYKTPAEKNVQAEAVKFALANYLGPLAAFVLFYGIVGMILGINDIGTMITSLFLTWARYWFDLVLWIVVSLFMATIGSFAAARKPQGKEEAAEYLVSTLQQPTPRAFPPPQEIVVPARARVPATSPVQPLPAQVAPVPVSRVYCEYCGARLEAGARFCGGCGVSLEGVIVAEAPKVVVPQVPSTVAQTPVAPATAPSVVSEARAPPARRATVVVPVAKKTPAVSEAMLESWERALHRIDAITTNIGIALMAISVLASLVIAFFGNIIAIAYALLSLPFGIIALLKDRTTFSKWIFERNYSSRGIDLLLWGILGSMCAGAGALIIVKGVLMTMLTESQPTVYPRLTPVQWRARLFQATTTIASPMMALATLTVIANIFRFSPFGISWGIIMAFVGFVIYSVYEHVIRPEILSGRLLDMDVALLVTGIIGTIVNGGGIFILIQAGLVIATRNEQRAAETLTTEQAPAQASAPGNGAVATITVPIAARRIPVEGEDIQQESQVDQAEPAPASESDIPAPFDEGGDA
jgi:hypothetical protein